MTTPSFMLVLWMCAGDATCPLWKTPEGHVMVMPAETRQQCEDEWKQSLRVPDPPGFKSWHKCQPIGEDL